MAHLRSGRTGAGGPVRSGSFDSPAAGGSVGWVIAYPTGVDPDHPLTPAGRRLPVCLVLHGRGGDAQSMLGLGFDRLLGTGAEKPQFALASVDGGTAYWHRRRDGRDPGAMIIDEFLPRLTASGLAARASDRIALLGWSMGGYGALLLGATLGRRRVAAVVAESPALWLHPGDSAPGAFDDAGDFARYDIFARRPQLSGIAVRVDCGLSDPFLRATKVFVAGMKTRPAGGYQPGGHDDAYWRRMAPEQFRFVGQALASS